MSKDLPPLTKIDMLSLLLGAALFGLVLAFTKACGGYQW